MTRAASLLLVGLPLCSGFGTVSRTGTSADIGTESAGQKDFRPDIYGFPTDVCPNLFTKYTPIEKANLWCGAFTKDECANEPGSGGVGQPGKVLLKPGDSTVTSTGTAVSYNVCAWDNIKNKCRMASYSYLCHTSCSGVPQDTPRSSTTANIGLDLKPKTKIVPCGGGIEAEDTHGGVAPFGFCTTTEYEPTLIWSGRRLDVKPVGTKKQRRKLQAGDCTKMADGRDCCEGIFGLTEFFHKETYTTPGPRSSDPEIIAVGANGVEGEGYVQEQSCVYDSAADTCACSISEGSPISGFLCEDSIGGFDGEGYPSPWGMNGARRLESEIFRK